MSTLMATSSPIPTNTLLHGTKAQQCTTEQPSDALSCPKSNSVKLLDLTVKFPLARVEGVSVAKRTRQSARPPSPSPSICTPPPPPLQQVPQQQQPQQLSSPAPSIAGIRKRKLPKADLQALQQRAHLHRYDLFTLLVRAMSSEEGSTQVVGKAIVDNGASINVVSREVVDAMLLTPSATDNFVRLADGRRVQTDGKVNITISVSGSQNDLPSNEIEFEVLPVAEPFMILGKPWKTALHAIQFYELDIIYVPDFSKHSFIRSWIPLMSTTARQRDIPVPDTPMAAIRMLIAAQPCMPNIEDLERSILDSAHQDEGNEPVVFEMQAVAEENELADLSMSWSELDSEQPVKRQVRFEEKADPEELLELQSKLPLNDFDVLYEANRLAQREQFQPYRVNGKEDNISEERAERIAALLEKQFGTEGTAAERQHLRALLKEKHLAFAETSADCKQNCKVICDPVLIMEPPNMARRSKSQPLSPPQKEFLHRQVRELIENGFLVKIDEDRVCWISETRIVPKPAAEIDSNVSIEELRKQVNASLKKAGLSYDPNLEDPMPITAPPPTAETTKARYRLVHNYAPINRYMRDAAFVPGNITLKASKLSNKRYLFKGDGCAGFFIVANSELATMLSVTYIEDLGFYGYTVMPFGFKVGPSLYYRFITTAFGDLFDRDSDFWIDDVAAGHQDFGAYFTWLRVFLDRAIDSGFTLSVNKCRFLYEEITFCGQVVGQKGISIDPNRLRAIVDWPKPKTVRELMVFRGVCSYLRSKIPGFAKIFGPMDELTQRVESYDQSLENGWTNKHDAAFLQIKHALVNSKVLKEPRYDRPFIVHSDWSLAGMGQYSCKSTRCTRMTWAIGKTF
ncbi:uncharacterized protein UTRI_10377 [Ustilago trichophora]|uniref:Uncharacterized protein n=1 Tax=Ustilago trichophora TaxID=86804 RepID=A0A5C3EAQ5_9BASI|nr:uncharacterized protein UTRI_10377 [Ustilago trichophora]